MSEAHNGPPRAYNVAVVGATGLVGETLLALMEERRFPLDDLRLFSTARSAGAERSVLGRSFPTRELPDDACADVEQLFGNVDVAFFAAGEAVARRWAPALAARGVLVVDKSAAFRLDPAVPLLVPEVNAKSAMGKNLIANPNCSSIPIAVALNMIQREFGLRWVSATTYQSVSGAGKDALAEFNAQLAGEEHRQTLPRRIAGNVIPEIGEFDESGYCGEERKIAAELQKILSSPEMKVSATTVRVPVAVAHAAAVSFEPATDARAAAIAATIAASPGVQFLPGERYVSSLEAAGSDAVFVGRLRADTAHPGAYLMWVACDNLRKGAATNALQIAELLLPQRLAVPA